jgi:hypothetical protein
MKTKDPRTFKSVLIVATLLLALSPFGLTQNPANSSAVTVPHLIKFSGAVKDNAGAPQTGVVGITFTFYKDQQGGAPLWLETQNVQADANGRYTVMLGTTRPDGLPMEFFSSNEARWVGVQPQGQNEQPRVLLVSAPYALKAADAETLGGKPLSAFQLAAPQTTNSSTKTALSPSEQPNEISCAGNAACKTSFIPKFSTNGGSAKVNNSVISQTGTAVGIAGSLSLSGNLNASTGQVLGQTGFFTANTSGGVVSVGNQNPSGIAVLGVNTNTNGSGVGVQGNGPNGVVGNGTTRGVTGTGLIGVEGDASGTNSIGVSGTGSTGVLGNGGSNGTGVKGTGVIALLGEAPSTNSLGLLATGGTGVFGGSQQTGDNFWGMMGTATNSGKNLGVEGFSGSVNGTGLYGLAITSSHVGGIRGCCPVGVWGDTGSNAGGAAGLVGTADDARAIYLENNSPSGVPTAYMQQDASGKFALVAGGGGSNVCTIDATGTLSCAHAMSVIAPVESGQRDVALYAMESPQNWFEDFGSGQLSSGTTRITLDATFTEAVNTGVQYHVFLTPRDECEGLYVSNATASGFEVHELHHGQTNVTFDYRIVALRRGFETVRSEDMTEQWKKMNALPKITPAQGIKPPSIPRVPGKSDINPLPKLSVQR